MSDQLFWFGIASVVAAFAVGYIAGRGDEALSNGIEALNRLSEKAK